jgi:prepilin-type N-terminal cleavage/methylation domain-containing protein
VISPSQETTVRTPHVHKPAFTLIELLVSIAIVALLIGLIVVGFNRVLGAARGAGEKQAAASIKLGVEQFKQEFGFLPPLVLHDEETLVSGTKVKPIASNGAINTFGGTVSSSFYNPSDTSSFPSGNTFLKGFWTNKPMTSDGRLNATSPINGVYVADRRFSEHSLAYYLVGALPAAVDGIDGPGMLPPNPDGSFSKPGPTNTRSTRIRDGSPARVYTPYVDMGRNAPRLDVSLEARVAGEPTYPFRYRLMAPNGKPYRYYRWERRTAADIQAQGAFTKWDFYLPTPNYAAEDEIDKLNIPSILGNPRENAGLRDAQYAIVSAGPDGYYGDMPFEAKDDDALFAMQSALGVPRGTQYNARTREAARRDNIVEVGR